MNSPIDTRVQFDTSFVLNSLRIPPTPANSHSFTFSEICTDSRQITPDSLFVALKGERVDAHDFIPAVIQAGARGVVCKKGTADRFKDLDPVVHLFEVNDPLLAFRDLAQKWREKFKIPVIVVAGSAGKTTTKELLACILQGKWHSVLKTQASQNGFIGIPMTLLGLRPHHEGAVIEVGIDEVGAMIQHMQLVQPTASLLTAIGPEHLEKLIDLRTVAHEESIALTEVASRGEFIAVNLDDPWIAPLAALKTKKKLGFSLTLHDHQDLEVLSGELSPDHSTLTLTTPGKTTLEISLPLPGRHNVMNLLGAISIALGLGLSLEEIQQGLQTFQGAQGRSEVRVLPGDTTVICDYYNAQPASMRAGLQMLCDFHRKSNSSKSRWACLGDMLELGPSEESFHRDLATQIIEEGIENVLLFGPRMFFLSDELKSRGFRGYHAHFKTHAELSRELASRIQPGDTLLIKGSRGMKMEDIWRPFQEFAASNWGPLQVEK